MKCFLDGMWRGEEGKRAGAVPRPNRFREPPQLQARYMPVLIRTVSAQPGGVGKVWKGGSAWGMFSVFQLTPVSEDQYDAKGKAHRNKLAMC